MCNTILLQLPGGRRRFLYYIALSLLLCVFATFPFLAHAEEIVESSSSSSGDTTDPDNDLSLGGDLTDAYNKYAGGLTDGLDDTKQQFDGLVDDSVLQLVQVVTGWIPAEIWAVFGLSVAAMVVLATLRYLRS